MATRFWNREYVFLNSLGVPRALGKLKSYDSNTSAPQITYSDDALVTENQTTITLNLAGRLPVDVFGVDADYKFSIENADGTDSITIDPVHGGIGVIPDASAFTAIATGGSSSRTLAKRFADTVNVKDYGEAVSAGYVVGSGGDDTAAFVAALGIGQGVYVPHGAYKVTTNQLTLLTGQKFYGDGLASSVITSFSTTGSILTIGGQASLQSYIDVRDVGLHFDNSVARTAGQKTIHVSNAAYFNIFRNDMLNGLVNLSANDCLIYTVRDNEIRNGQVNVDLVPSATYYPTHNLVTFEGNRITGATSQAIRAEGTGNNTFHQLIFEGNDIESNGTDGSGLNVCSFTNVGKTGVGPGVTFRNNWFENNHGLRDLSITGNNTNVTLELSGNAFFSTAVTTDNVAIATGRVFGDGNGLIASGPTYNISFAADTTGEFSSLSNNIARLHDLGTVVTQWGQYTPRALTTLSIVGTTGSAGAFAQTITSEMSKNGTRVTVDFESSTTNLGSYTGTVQINGIPLSRSGAISAGSGIIWQFDGINLTSAGTNVSIRVPPNVTYAEVFYSIDAGSSLRLPISQLTATVTLNGSFSYDAAS